MEYCAVTMAVLQNEPYNLQSGDLILVRAAAMNEIGEGEFSTTNMQGIKVAAVPKVMDPPAIASFT